MRRIDRLLGNDKCDYPGDVRQLRMYVTEIRHLADSEVERLYKEFSDDMYAAGWMRVDRYTCNSFQSWLNHDDEAYQEDSSYEEDEEELDDEERQNDQKFINFMKKHGLKKQ